MTRRHGAGDTFGGGSLLAAFRRVWMLQQGRMTPLLLLASLALLTGALWLWYFIQLSWGLERRGGIIRVDSIRTSVGDHSELEHPQSAPEPEDELYTMETEISSQKSSRRFAVCISGARASALLSPTLANALIQHILLPNDADLFIYVSQNDDEGPFDMGSLHKLLSPWLRSVVVKNNSALEDEVAYFRAHQTAPGPRVLEGRFGNDMRYFHKVYKCQNTLIAAFEESRGQKYHSILQTRADILYERTLEMKPYTNSSTFYSTVDVLVPYYYDHTRPYGTWGAADGLNDQVFLLTSDAMKLVSNAIWVLMSLGPEYARQHPYFPENDLHFMVREKFGFGLELMQPNEFYRLVRQWDRLHPTPLPEDLPV